MNATASEAPQPAPADNPDGLKLVLPGRGVPLGSGWDWIAGSWKLFLRAPLMWIISIILIFIVFIAISLVPILGSLAVQLLQPVVLAGFMLGCHSLERGGDFELDHLLGGFKKNFANLIVVGALFLVGGIVIFLVFLAFVMITVGTAFLSSGDPSAIMGTIMASAITILLGLLFVMALLLPLMAAYWFAPVLVVMHDVPPLEAMKASFFACFRNFFPFIVYGLVWLVLAVIAAIPFGLGFLVLVPMTIASVYVSYREIFTEEAAAPPAKPTFA